MMDGPFRPTVVIPLPPASEYRPGAISNDVALWLPVPLTREQWSHMMIVLQAMRPGLVEPDNPSAPQAK